MKLIRSEQGSAFILTVVFMSVLITLFALNVDGGMLFLSKSKLQKSLDSAVLAGAQNLPDRPDLAQTEAQKTVIANGISNRVNIDFNSEYTSIHADSTEEESILFNRVLGLEQTGVHASAKVQLIPLISGMGAIPLGVQAGTPLIFGTQVQLKAGTSNVGNFGALALNGPGAKDYETNLTYGYNSELDVNDILDTQTGNITQPTIRAIESRMTSCPMQGSASYTDYPTDCPLVVLIPVYDPILDASNQMKQVKIVGFASFFLESVGPTNDGAIVTGRFIQKTYSGSTSPTQPSYGAYGYRLIE
ncbi:MAG TPA: Tad domain-containing protein [Bacillota bacterium]|nr:Tad domain-containing protein [Bacillota bacterium]